MKKLMMGFGIASLLTGCMGIRAPFQPPDGGIVSSYKAPLSTEGNWKTGSKMGQSSAINVIGVVTVGDCSIKAAMQNGGLKEVNYADYEYFNILGLYQKITVQVTGE